MAEAPKAVPDPRAQIDKFKDPARELGADDGEGRFKEKLVRGTKAQKA